MSLPVGDELPRAKDTASPELPVGIVLVAVGIGVLMKMLGIPIVVIGAFLLIVRLAIRAWRHLAAILSAGAGTVPLAAD